MRRFGKILGRVLLLLIVAIGALYLFGPHEKVSLTPTVVDADIGEDVSAHFAAQESRFGDITPGTEKRVVWYGEPGARTPLALVYVHGFSATSEEIRPVPDRVAQDLGANLVYTRLQGHGRDGQALAEATVQGWADDVAEALIVARRVADEVVIVSTSTGGTMVAGMLDQPDVMDGVKGLIFVSPNFGIKAAAAKLLTWPAARYWVPLVAGADRSFTPSNEAHATFWTTAYPTVAVLPMAELVRQVFAKDYSGVDMPALFWFAEEDQVVDAARTRAVAAQWGNGATVAIQSLGTQSDEGAHVIAGDIMSPGETEKAVSGFAQFIRSLP